MFFWSKLWSFKIKGQENLGSENYPFIIRFCFYFQQIVNLTDGWTEYYRQQGEYVEDSTHEDVMLLLEAGRPTNVDDFIEHELQIDPAEKVHVRILDSFTEF